MTATERNLYKLVSVTGVEVLHDHVVRLRFSDGCEGELDLGPMLCGPIFEPLRSDYTLFRQVQVPPDEVTIVWPNGADMAPEVLHVKAIHDCPDPYGDDEVSPPTYKIELEGMDITLLLRILPEELDRLHQAGYDDDRDWQAAQVVDLIAQLNEFRSGTDGAR